MVDFESESIKMVKPGHWTYICDVQGIHGKH